MAHRWHHRRPPSRPDEGGRLLGHADRVAGHQDHRRRRGHVADDAQRRWRRWASRRPSSSASATPHSSRARNSRAGPPGAADDAYYHPLMLPQGFTQLNLVPHWMHGERRRRASATSSRPQGRLCDDGLAPKTDHHRRIPRRSPTTPITWTPGKFAPFLQKHCTEKLGVRHVLADVVQVNQTERGDIESVAHASRPARSPATCSSIARGFAALLIGKTLGVRFKDCSDVLFCDTRSRCRCRMRPRTLPWPRRPSPRRRRPAGSGISACPRGAASATSTPAGTPRRGSRTRELLRYIGPAANGSDAAQDPDPRAAIARPSGRTIASRSGSPADSSSRWSPRPSCWSSCRRS